MPHTIKVGDKFRLGGEEFEVELVGESGDWFQYFQVSDATTTGMLPTSIIESLDWITPPVMISKEAADRIKKEFMASNFNSNNVWDSLFQILDSITEK